MSRHLSAIDKQETMHKIKLEEIENKWKTDIENSRKISNKHIHNLEQEIRRLNTEIKQLNR